MQRCLLVLYVCAGGIALFAGTDVSNTLAVLPFANVSQTGMSASDPAALDWIGESIAETLRAAAAGRGLSTLERGELEDAFRRLRLRERSRLTDASVLKLGETVDAEQVVFGTFEYQRPAPGAQDRGSLKISGRVYDRRRMKQSSEFTESGALEDLATLEAHLAWRALSLLAPELAPAEPDFRTMRSPVRLDAEENYTRGLLARTPEQKEKYFSQAARLDARFSRPAFELGRLNYNRKQYRVAADWLEKIGANDAHYREASFLLGLSRYYSGDYAASQKAFQMIATQVPLGSVYNNLGASESRRGMPQALDDFRKALESDPGDPDYLFNVGYALWRKGDYTAAADRFRAVLDRVPEDDMATLLLGRCLKKQGFNPALDSRLTGVERLKSNYEERAWRLLKSLVESKTPPPSGPDPKTVDSKLP
jgi:tetratricopeptide (TPR) repeat protein